MNFSIDSDAPHAAAINPRNRHAGMAQIEMMRIVMPMIIFCKRPFRSFMAELLLRRNIDILAVQFDGAGKVRIVDHDVVATGEDVELCIKATFAVRLKLDHFIVHADADDG